MDIKSGLNFKTLPMILADIKSRLSAAFPGLNFSDESAINQLISSPAYELSIAYEELERVFYSQYPFYAEGFSLDFAMQFTGNKRLIGRPQIIEITYKGSNVSLAAKSVFFSKKNPAYSFTSALPLTVSNENTVTLQTLSDIDYPVSIGDELSPKDRIEGFISAIVTRIVQSGLTFESDEALKSRFIDQLSLQARSVTEGIKSVLLSIQGVQSVIIIENLFDTVDQQGRPPGAVEIIVAGGNDQQIADAIENAISPGTTLFGVPIKATSGRIVRFSRAIAKPIYFLLEFTINPFLFNSDQATIIEKFVSRAAETFKQGDDVILTPTCISFLSDIDGLIFVTIRAGIEKGIYTASSGVSQMLDFSGNGVIDRDDQAIFMKLFNQGLASKSQTSIEIDRDEIPTFNSNDVSISIKVDSNSASSVPIEIKATFLVDKGFPENGQELIVDAFFRSIETLEVARSVSVFQTLAPSIQSLGNYLEASILIKRKSDTEFKQYIAIEKNEIATVSKTDISVAIKRQA